MSQLEKTLKKCEKKFWQQFDGSCEPRDTLTSCVDISEELAIALFAELLYQNGVVRTEEDQPVPARSMVQGLVWMYVYEEVERRIIKPESATRIIETIQAYKADKAKLKTLDQLVDEAIQLFRSKESAKLLKDSLDCVEDVLSAISPENYWSIFTELHSNDTRSDHLFETIPEMAGVEDVVQVIVKHFVNEAAEAARTEDDLAEDDRRQLALEKLKREHD